jgi:tRNA pseudouridine38-40 synthase
MPRYKLTFEFDGSDFSGWQVQPDTRTVEGVIEDAFSTLYQVQIDIIGQGRTDSGVHAIGQTAHADLPDTYTVDRILYAMRGLLPDDVALLRVDKVEEDFHARFYAQSRKYRYAIYTRPSPLKRRTSWFVHGELDYKLLKASAEILLGVHDFRNFCIPPESPEMTTKCSIKKSEWKIESSGITYLIEGDRFLRHMVRRLVGSMVETALGKMSIEDFESLLTGPEQQQKAHSAPAHGLTLVEVMY